MKQSLFSVLLVGGMLIAACEGPTGPRGATGPQGPQGPPGSGSVDLTNEVFEVTANFTPANGYFQAFDLNPAIGANDVVLAYLLWEVDGNLDIWRPMPQMSFLNEGILQYNFDFTRFDFGLFLDANFDLGQLGPQFTENQVFRIVLVPGQLLQSNPDVSSYEEVMALVGKSEDDVRRADWR